MLSLTQKCQIEALLKPWDKDGPGMIVAAEKCGSRVFTLAVGHAHLDFDITIDEDTLFQIASTSKQFTAACLAMLILQGRVRENDPIDCWFNDLPTCMNGITVEMLIHHTSGLRDTLPMRMLAGGSHEDHFTYEEQLALISRQRGLNFPPGTAFKYNNAGYSLMAGIIEKVTGKKLSQYAYETFFAPLGMHRTRFDDNHTQVMKNRAVSYECTPSGLRTVLKNDDICGETGIITNISDLFLWSDNLSSGKAGGSEFVELMCRTGRTSGGNDTGYAFGLMLDTKYGRRRVHHSGSVLSFRSQFIKYPDENLTIICLANTTSISPVNICDQIFKILYNIEDNSGAGCFISIDEATLSTYVGLFRGDRSGWICQTMVNDKGSLNVLAFGRTFETIAIDESTFVHPESQTQFAFAQQGDGLQLKVCIDGVFFDEFTVQSPVSKTEAELKAMCGMYESDELGARYIVSEQEGDLFVTRRGLKLERLLQGIGDRYVLDAAFIQFNKDAAGCYTGLTVSGERIVGIDFIKAR